MNASTRDLFVLLALGLAEPLEPRVALLEVLRVVAVVVGDRPQREIGDARDDRVEEVAVVRDEDDRVRIGDEVFLEPVARVEVEMVGRLVEQQQVGRPSSSLASAMRICQPPENVSVGSLRPSGRTRGRAAPSHLRRSICSRPQAEAILQLAVAREHRLVLRSGTGRRRGAPRCRASRP